MRRPVDLPNSLRPHTVDPLLVKGWARALVRGKRLPPGRMSPPLDAMERSDRNALMLISQKLGPVFKGTAWGGALWIYVFGLERGRNLLRQHDDELRPVTIDLESLFPIGLMRQMEGENHRHYRADLMRAIRPADIDEAKNALCTIVSRHLAQCASSLCDSSSASKVYRAVITDIATDLLLRLIFGTEPGDPLHHDLQAGYRALGGTGMVWNVQQRQADAFNKLAGIVREELVRLDTGHVGRSCVLSRLAQRGPIDATTLGNIIYMVEMGRHDIAGFLRWLT